MASGDQHRHGHPSEQDGPLYHHPLTRNEHQMNSKSRLLLGGALGMATMVALAGCSAGTPSDTTSPTSAEAVHIAAPLSGTLGD